MQRILQAIFLRPVVPLLFSLTSGILFCSFVPGGNSYALLLFIGTGISILTFRYKKKDPKLPALFFFACLGYITMHPHVSPDLPSNHIVRFTNSGKVTIYGKVFGKPVQKGFRLKFYLNSEAVLIKGIRHTATGKLRVTSAGGFPLICDGDTIMITGSIKSIRNFNNPGGFDYKRHMSFKGIHATVYAKASHIIVIERKTIHHISDYIVMYRERISALIESTIREEHKYVLKALLIGEKTDIPKTLREDFTKAGAAHLLAISGLHIGIIASLSFFLFKGRF